MLRHAQTKRPIFSDFYSFLLSVSIASWVWNIARALLDLADIFAILQLDSNLTRFISFLLYSSIVIYGDALWVCEILLFSFIPRHHPCTSMRVWIYSRGRRSFSSFPYLLKPKCARSTSWWRPFKVLSAIVFYSVLISFFPE